MKSVKIKNIISLLLNIIMAILVVIAVIGFFVGEGLNSGAGNMDAGGFLCFRYFTIDSNILAALCGLFIIPFNTKAVKSGNYEIPQWATVLKLIGTVAVTVTFVVVLVFLGPIIGYKSMFEGNCFLLHLVCPLISVFSFCFFEKGVTISKKEALYGIIPVAIYGTVYLINVIFTKTWEDFYHFNIGGFWYISFIVMLSVTYVLSLIISVIHNKQK